METTYGFAKDGSITWIGDSQHAGTDVYWSERLQMWVFVDLEKRRVQMARRFLVAQSTAEGDTAALNQLCLASDRDGECSTWVLSIEGDDFSRDDTIEFVFDSNVLD